MTVTGARVEVHGADAGSRQIVDGQDVGAAERVDVDPLDAGRVHRDRADVAEEPEPVAVRRQVDPLGRVGAVEAQHVRAVLTFDGVAAVTRIPDERVVACAEERRVAAPVPVERVVPVPAQQRLGSRAAGDRVVTGTAVDGRRNRGREGSVALVDTHEVVASPGIDRDPRDRRALEACVGGSVVADVDLQNARLSGLQA